uniref:DH domain-containing protein n=1 Tax=Syphacia muris TaxID=451379 RepID=A0A0N5AW92_9BILA
MHIFFQTREELEKALQEPINRIKLYAKLLARMISKTSLDDPSIDFLSDAFGAVDLEDEYEMAVTAWAAERIKECEVDLREQGDLYRHMTIHFSKNGGDLTLACLFVYDKGLVITTPELYDLPPEHHGKELTFLHYIPLPNCEVITGSKSDDKLDIKVSTSEGGKDLFSFRRNGPQIKFSPASPEGVAAKPIQTLENSPESKSDKDKGLEGQIQAEPQLEVKAADVLQSNAEDETEESEKIKENIQEKQLLEEEANVVTTPRVDRTTLLSFWRTKEEEAKIRKKNQTSRLPLLFKYGKEVGEEERKARAFKLKESSRFKFWKLKEQEMKKMEKQKTKSREKTKRPETEVDAKKI